MYTNRGRTRKGRWCHLTFFGKSTQGAEHRSRKARRYPGAVVVTDGKEDREGMIAADVREPQEETIAMLDQLERVGYRKMAEALAGDRLAEARQIVDLMKDVGLV